MRRAHALLVVPLAAGALLLAWWAPWSSAPDPVPRALQAFGNEPVVHVVMKPRILADGGHGLDLPEERDVEVWWDGSTRRLHLVKRVEHRIRSELVAQGSEKAEFDLRQVDPSLPFFVLGYRRDLARHSLKSAGSGTVLNRRVLWVGSQDIQVAIDPVSYQPLWLRRVRFGKPDGILTPLATAETKPLDPADFLTAKQKKARHL